MAVSARLLTGLLRILFKRHKLTKLKLKKLFMVVKTQTLRAKLLTYLLSPTIKHFLVRILTLILGALTNSNGHSINTDLKQ